MALTAASATEMAKLADLFYESNKDCNLKVDAKRNFISCGNQYFKPKNLLMPYDSESNINDVNSVSEDKKPELVAEKLERPVPSQIRCFHCKILNQQRSECHF